MSHESPWAGDFRLPPAAAVPSGSHGDLEGAVTTRGQHLPGLIQVRSSSSLLDLQRRFNKRRHSSQVEHEHEERHSLDSNDMSSPLRKTSTYTPRSITREWDEVDARRMNLGPDILYTPQIRSMRLIGNSNPRYKWQKYYKTDEQLKEMRKPMREYYKRTNYLIARYLYIDALLDSSLPHDLLREYENNNTDVERLPAISEESTPATGLPSRRASTNQAPSDTKVKRTPKTLYKLPHEGTPLLGAIDQHSDEDPEAAQYPEIKLEDEEETDFSSKVVTVAIYINLAANILLLGAKIAVIVLTSSLSVLASLVDAALDFLSTAIVWATTQLIARQDQYAYPIGRRRLEPVGVLVFSVIMVTSFFQVALECLNRLISGDRSIVELSIPSIVIMLSTVVVKGFCWFWCRLVKNSSVQALAQDAVTDVVFNTFSIIFPLVGFYAKIWWMDALGGLLLSFYVIFNWSNTSSEHVRNLCGAAASADERNILLYLTMRFAKTIRYIQGLQAYHAGDKLNVEVDIVLDEDTSLIDSHDLGESLQYVLESVPTVDRAFVHTDYRRENIPSHMNQQGE